MSDFRDPREPMGAYDYRHGYDHQSVRRMQAEAMGTAWGMGPIIGLLLLLGVMFFAFSASDTTQVARNEPAPPATTQPAPSGN
jgi:hypothetical protein